MPFLEAFLWGSGLSIGMCVGLIVWTIVRTKLLTTRGDTHGVTHLALTHLALTRKSVALLEERNRLTVEMIEALERIADRYTTGRAKDGGA